MKRNQQTSKEINLYSNSYQNKNRTKTICPLLEMKSITVDITDIEMPLQKTFHRKTIDIESLQQFRITEKYGKTSKNKNSIKTNTFKRSFSLSKETSEVQRSKSLFGKSKKFFQKKVLKQSNVPVLYRQRVKKCKINNI